MAAEYIHLEVEEVVASTAKALLLRIDGDEVWVPRFVIADDEDYERGDKGATISVLEWWAKKEGIGE
jgi:hypothetical protein